ncbi:hypothetical protein BPOR_0304g00090 [Botrytis porri]|uniref:Uncharacterized protein n=2 Tax=Botrytis porri TaxID=87229 RepID=A0A4Z1KSV8_9HELO|nr:hypothetical protein BPOR_0304g00090 [Botrytis porri]
MDEKKRDGGIGLKGKLKVMRERRTWRSNGAFEGVGAAERAVQAKKKGDRGGVKAVFKRQKKELENAERPRKGVAAELEEDKIRRQQGIDGNDEEEEEVHPETGHDERQVVVEEGSAKPEGKDMPQLIA